MTSAAVARVAAAEGAALDALPRDLLAKARLVALSTTLATNACVEGQGGRARLVMMGSSQKTLRWVGADKKYGLNYDDVLCIDTHGSFDGTFQQSLRQAFAENLSPET